MNVSLYGLLRIRPGSVQGIKKYYLEILLQGDTSMILGELDYCGVRQLLHRIDDEVPSALECIDRGYPWVLSPGGEFRDFALEDLRQAGITLNFSGMDHELF